MRLASTARRLLALPTLAWSGWFLWVAFGRWSWSVRCAMICPAFIDAEDAPAHYRAMDWQAPLLLACLPLALGVAARLLGIFLRTPVSTRPGAVLNQASSTPPSPHRAP